MSGHRPRVGGLTPEELELLALEHVESLFMELRAAGQAVREQYNPVKLIQRHPLAAAGLAAAAGLLLARRLRRKPAGGAGKTAPGGTPGWFDSLLSGLAGSAGHALPELVASWLTRGGRSA